MAAKADAIVSGATVFAAPITDDGYAASSPPSAGCTPSEVATSRMSQRSSCWAIATKAVLIEEPVALGNDSCRAFGSSRATAGDEDVTDELHGEGGRASGTPELARAETADPGADE
jgi:hypothetical protein